jgi:apolipoprotein N-acyltransferase
VASAALLALSFAPYDLPLVWFALVPWLWELKKTRKRGDALIQGLWLSFLYALVIEYWVAYALQSYVALSWPVAVAALLAYALVAHLELAAFGMVFKLAQGRGRLSLARLGGLAAAYVAIDWATPKLYKESIGHMLHWADNLRQLAHYGGVESLAFLAAAANLAFFASRRAAIAVAALLLATWGFGYLERGRVIATFEHPVNALNVLVFQGNIDNSLRARADLGDGDALKEIAETYLKLTRQALAERKAAHRPAPGLLVWPESAYPSPFGSPPSKVAASEDERLRAFVREAGIPLVFGAPDMAIGPGGREISYNSVRVLRPDGGGQTYRKSRLVPFGEYVPGAESFPPIAALFSQIESQGAGPGPAVMNVAGTRLAPAICYEILFPDHARAGARLGAHVILNLTNDSWFGPFSEPYLHLALSRFRSIETRLPQIRATNTGVTALILPDGSLRNVTRIFERTVVEMEVPLPVAEEILTARQSNAMPL